MTSVSAEIMKLPLREDFVAGADAGGTKVELVGSLSSEVYRYKSSDYPDLETVIGDYCRSVGFRPGKLVIGLAGLIDDETGEVKVTNTNWPVFDPRSATEASGIDISTTNDMVITAAGVLETTGVDLITLKPGTPKLNGTKAILSLSTGIGTAGAFWDDHSERYVILASEGGHISYQPKTPEEHAYIVSLQKKYPHVSIELAIGGKYGIDNLVDHFLTDLPTETLADAVENARQSENPVGAVLLGFALEGSGSDRETAKTILSHLGAMAGSAVRDLTMLFKATGGVYLTGSIALALGEYLAANTEFNDRFVREGAVHDKVFEKIQLA